MQQNNQKISDEGPSGSLKKQIGRLLEYFKPSVSEEGEGPVLPRFFIAFLLLFGAGMLVISLYGEQGLIAYSELEKETARLEREV